MVTKKCKQCEIYKNGQKHGLQLTVDEVEAHWHSNKEKVPDAAVSKEGHADSVLGHKKTHHHWFPWKRCNCNQCIQLPTAQVKFTLFIEWLSKSQFCFPRLSLLSLLDYENNNDR